MQTALLLVSLLSSLLTPIDHGRAVYYADGVMRRVVERRRAGLTTMDLPPPGPEIGNVARPYCAEVGGMVFLKFHKDRTIYGPFRVADCTAAKDQALVAQRNIVVELEWAWAERIGITRTGWTTVTVYIIAQRGEPQWNLKAPLLENDFRPFALPLATAPERNRTGWHAGKYVVN